MSDGGRTRRRFDRKLGRPLRARLDAPLSAAGPPRPPDRLLAAAAAVLVVGRRSPPSRAGAPAQSLAHRAVLHRRLRHARRRLHLERHRRSRPRRRRRAHALAADPVRAGERRAGGAPSWLLQALVGLAVLLQFNRFTIVAGIASLAVVAVYPFMKRITYWPQIVLGLAFSWGALMGWAAAFGRLDLPALSALCRRDRLGDRLRHDLCPSGSRGRCADRHQVDGAAVRRAHQADAGAVLRARGGADRRRRVERRRRRRVRARARRLRGASRLADRRASTSTIPTLASPCSSRTAMPG